VRGLEQLHQALKVRRFRELVALKRGCCFGGVPAFSATVPTVAAAATSCHRSSRLPVMTLQASTYRLSSARVIQVRAPSFCGLIVPSQIRL
jgi:hypothetical protein